MRTIEAKQSLTVDLGTPGRLVVFNLGDEGELPAKVAKYHVDRGQAELIAGNLDGEAPVIVRSVRPFTACTTVHDVRHLKPGARLEVPSEIARQLVNRGQAGFVDGRL